MAASGQAAARTGQGASDDSKARARMLQRHNTLMSNVDEMEENMLKEILGQTNEPKNWKGMIIAIAIIIITSGLIIAAIMLVMPKEHKIELGENFVISDIFDSAYQPLPVNLQWLPGLPIRYVHRDQQGNLRLTNAESNESSVLMSNETLKQKFVDLATLSSNGESILLSSETFNRRSHTTLAKYTVFDIKQKKDCQLKGHGAFLQYAAWIPNSNSVVFVDNNDVYVLVDACKPTSIVKALSSGGAHGGIYHGIPDPLYEDEILETDNALWPSEDGQWLVYATFNDSQLLDHKILIYDSSLNEYSPIVRSVHYPKAGNTTRNPVVTLSIVSMKNISEGRPLLLPSNLTESDYYLTSAKWVDNGHFFSSWLRRDYKRDVHVVCEAHTRRCELLRSTDYDNDEGQFCSSKPPVFVSGGLRPTYFFLSFTPSGSNGKYYKHIRKYASFEVITLEITTGAHDDIAILTHDAQTGSVYYLSTGGDPRARHLYRVSDQGLGQPVCVSCEIRGCEYTEASFSDNGTFYLLSCLGPDVPKHVLRSPRNMTIDVVLQDNSDLAGALAKKAKPLEHHVEVRLDEHITWARVLVPATHRPELLLRHSLVVILPIDGPDAQPASKKFHIGWETILAGEHVVAMVDTRGSDNHGLDFKMSIHGSAGKAEGLDVMSTARALMANASLGVDTNKPSVVVGEGYGGFVALHAQRTGTPFNCSVVTSPITDLGQYYTATAERYMTTSNKRGGTRSYEETSARRFVEELEKSHMFLIHELADDRYHFLNTAAFTKDLQLKGIHFESQISAFSQTYAGQANDFKRYYYQQVLNFLNKCLS